MRDAGNPPLHFEPDNETDDHTMVTLPINEEFACIREGKGGSLSGGAVTEGLVETHGDDSGAQSSRATTQNGADGRADDAKTTQNDVLEYLRHNPTASTTQIADSLDATVGSVRHILERLKKDERIRHVGPSRGGKWEIKELEGNEP